MESCRHRSSYAQKEGSVRMCAKCMRSLVAQLRAMVALEANPRPHELTCNPAQFAPVIE